MVKVSKTEELQGWRSARSEELQVIQGLLLTEAKRELRTEKIMNIFFMCLTYVCLVGVKNIIDYIRIAFIQGENSDIIILGVMLLGVFLFFVVVLATLIKNIKNKVAKIYYNAIKENRLRVNDVVIVEEIYINGTGDRANAYLVKVKDLYNTYCEESVPIESGYKVGEAILVEIPICISKNGMVARKRVIPCKTVDSRVWDIGLNKCNKLVE